MRTPTLLILLCLVSLTMKSQETALPAEDHKRITLGAYFSPDNAFRLLENTDTSATADLILDQREATEISKLGYTAGLSLIFHWSNHFALETGLTFSNKGYQTSKRNLTFGDLIDPRLGFIYPSNNTNLPAQYKFIYAYHYLGMPVNLNYTFGEKRCRFISSVGVTAEYLLNVRSTSVEYYEDGHKERKRGNDSSNYNRFNLSPSLSVGISYQLNEQMSLRAMPTARFGVLPIIDSPITGYLYNMGMQFGCYIEL